MSIEKSKYPLFDLAVECFAKDIVVRKPAIDLSRKPSVNEVNPDNLVFDMTKSSEILISGLGHREDDR